MSSRSDCECDFEYLLDMAFVLSQKLKGKKFDVISCHSGNSKVTVVIKNRRLKTGEVLVTGSLIRLLFYPSGSISFDGRDSPEIIHESKRVIRVVCHISNRDTVTRVIVVSED